MGTILNGREDLLRLARLFAEAKELRMSTLSFWLFQDTKKIRALEGDSDLHLGRYERAMHYLSDNWPDGVTWPADILRPTPRPPMAGAA